MQIHYAGQAQCLLDSRYPAQTVTANSFEMAETYV